MHRLSGLIVTVDVLFQWLLITVVAFLFIAADVIFFVVTIAALLHHHLILHVCTNQSQVLQIFFHKSLLSG